MGLLEYSAAMVLCRSEVKEHFRFLILYNSRIRVHSVTYLVF